MSAAPSTRGLRVSAVLAGLCFGAGLLGLFSVPGGGEVTDQQFTDFYASSEKRALALGGFFLLVAGSWLMTWFFTELRALLPAGRAADVGLGVARTSALASVVGAGVALGPVGVQMNSAGSFVGVPVAHALDQAGLLVTIVGGLYGFGVALFLLCLQARPQQVLARGMATAGLVVAVLLVAAYVAVPAFLLPLWVLVAGAAGVRRSVGSTQELVEPVVV